MEHLKLLKSTIDESENLANTLWLEKFGLSQISIWDRIKFGVIISAIVTRRDQEVDEEWIVHFVTAQIGDSPSSKFIIDPLFGVELEKIVREIRNTSDSNEVSVEFNFIASALLSPVLTCLNIGIEDLSEKRRKTVEEFVRDIGSRASVASLFYIAAKKKS
jgi:hypothetical protein